jgi:hypothetical protein
MSRLKKMRYVIQRSCMVTYTGFQSILKRSLFFPGRLVRAQHDLFLAIEVYSYMIINRRTYGIMHIILYWFDLQETTCGFSNRLLQRKSALDLVTLYWIITICKIYMFSFIECHYIYYNLPLSCYVNKATWSNNTCSSGKCIYELFFIHLFQNMVDWLFLGALLH